MFPHPLPFLPFSLFGKIAIRANALPPAMLDGDYGEFMNGNYTYIMPMKDVNAGN